MRTARDILDDAREAGLQYRMAGGRCNKAGKAAALAYVADMAEEIRTAAKVAWLLGCGDYAEAYRRTGDMGMVR